MTKITFGADGWRAIMGKEFTSSNVKVVAQAVADYMKDHGLESRGVVVGYDTRKCARRFKAFRFQCRIRVWYATDRPILQPSSDGDIQASSAQSSEDLGSLETATH